MKEQVAKIYSLLLWGNKWGYSIRPTFRRLHLKLVKNIKIETFYFEDTWFIHWGNFLKFPEMTAAVYHWKDNKLSYPIYRYIHLNDRFGYIDIAFDNIKFDIRVPQREREDFFANELKKFES